MAEHSAASRKVNETARAHLASLLLTEFSDPRLELITVTGVRVSKDRSVATVLVSSSPGHYDSTLAGLESAKGRLRSLLGRELGWRVTPELRFVIDTGVDHAQEIDAYFRNEE
ncbi:MAG: 30S ribosome-binding factor RbfA [Coriobacteriales bacterium]|jgi:ribosome-binding factor A|nr:30S ribosome-binding factor RbfA [Coriobacteriales bacterium]